MGVSESSEATCLVRETREFASWSLADVTQFVELFKSMPGFAITKTQFHYLLLTKTPQKITSDEIFEYLDRNHDDRIDGLEFIAALTCVNQAAFEEKAHFAFNLFDFNGNGSLTLAEVVLLLTSFSSGIQSFVSAKKSVAEPLSPIQLAHEAFTFFDRDQDKMLQPEEFILWARAHRSLMLLIERLRQVSEKSIVCGQDVYAKADDADSDLENETFESFVGVNLHYPCVYDSSFLPSVSCAPLRPEGDVNAPPRVNLELDWIYGSNGQMCRNWCCFVLGGDVAYFIAKYAIIYSPRTHSQRYYCGHRQDITCLRTNSSMELIVTGDGALFGSQNPLVSQIHVWHVTTLQRLAILKNASLGRQVALLSFCATSITRNDDHQREGHTIRAMNASHSAYMTPSAKSVDNLVLAIGSGIDSLLMLWDWENGRILASGRAGPVAKRVLACALNQDGFEAVTCGEQFVMFHELDGSGKVNSYRPSDLQNSSDLPTCVSVAYISTRHVVVGTTTGKLFHFHQSRLIKVVEAHSMSLSINVCAVSYGAMVLLTGGKDGHIKFWNAELENVDVIDLHTIIVSIEEMKHGEDCRISSLSYDVARKQFLIGTRKGNIFLIEEHKSGINEVKSQTRFSLRHLAMSHGALIDVASTWNASQFASCSGSEVFLWSLRQRICKRRIRLASPPSVLSFSGSGDTLAVGGKDGTLSLLSISEWRVRKRIQCCSKVQAIRFSPLDESISVGGANGIIYVYALDLKVFSLKKFTLLQPSDFPLMPVCALDYSRDGHILKSIHGNTISTAHFRFWDLYRQRGAQLSASTNLDWATYSVWDGIPRDEVCQKSGSMNVLSAACSNKHQTLLMHLDPIRGSLVLSCFSKENDNTESFRTMTKCIQSAHMKVHSPPEYVGIQSFVGFALSDRILLSSGITDGIICQWKVISEPVDEQATYDFEDSAPHLNDLYDAYCNEDDQQQHKRVSPFYTESIRSVQNAPDVNIILAGAIGRTNNGNQSLACVDDLTITSTGTLVRISPMDAQSKQHESYLFTPGSHHKTITNITLHPGGRYLATASRYDCRITIWDLQAFELRVQISPLTLRASPRVLSLAFDDHDGEILAIAWKEANRSHHLGIYEWSVQRCIVDSCVSQQAILFLAACSFQSSYVKEAGRSVSFITGGIKQITFWLLDRASEQLRCQKGVFGRYAIRKAALCALSMKPFLLTGMSDGSIIAWDRAVAACSYSYPTETRAETERDSDFKVVSLHHCVSRDSVISVHRNGDVRVWKYQYSCSIEGKTSQAWFHHFLTHMRSLNLFTMAWPSSFEPFISKSADDVKSSQICGSCNSEARNGLLISLTSGQLVFIKHQVFFATSEQGDIKKEAMVLMSEPSQNDGDFCFALHPKEELIVVSGSPGIISIRRLESINYIVNKSVISMVIDIKCLAWSTGGNEIAASMINGFIVFIDPITLKVVSSVCMGDKASTFDADIERYSQRSGKLCHKMRFSPNDQLLALASRDYRVYLYRRTAISSDIESREDSTHSNNPPTFELMEIFVGHKFKIDTLDFTSDSSWLRSSSCASAGEYFCWNVIEASQSFGNKSLQPSRQDTLDHQLRPEDFQTWTNTFTGPGAGFRGSGCQVSSIDRSHTIELNTSSEDNEDKFLQNDEKCVFAVGTTDGKVLLTSYPFNRGTLESALCKFGEDFYSCDAVISHVEFHSRNNFLVTMGFDCQNRHMIVAWRTDLQCEPTLVTRSPNRGEEEPLTARGDSYLFGENPEAPRLQLISRILHSREKDDYNSHAGIDSAIVRRKSWSLEFVYGSSVLGKNDVFYGPDPSTLIYASASIGVIHDTRIRSQSFMHLHGRHAITAMAMHPSGNIVASGDVVSQIDHRSHSLLVLWDSRTGCEVFTTNIIPEQYPGIQLARFSPQGDRLATIGLDLDHIMAIYEVVNLPQHVRSEKNKAFILREGKRNENSIRHPYLRHIGTVKTSKQTVCDIDFGLDNRLLTCGKNHLIFYHQSRGKNGISSITSGKAFLNSHPACIPGIIIYAAVHFTTVTQGSYSSIVISAQADGSLYVWKSRKCIDVRLGAHNGAIRALCVAKERNQHSRTRNLLYTLGDDHFLNIWNERLENIGVFNIDTYTKAFTYQDTIDKAKASDSQDHALMLHRNSKFKSICASNDRVLISTNQSEIFEILDLHIDPADQKRSEHVNGRVIFHVRGHCENLIPSGQAVGTFRGIASHPKKLRFASTSEDGNIQVWDAPSHSLLFHHSLNSEYAHKCPHVLLFSPDGKHISVGCKDGTLLIFNEELCEIIHEKLAGTLPITTMQFSDCGDLFAVGNTEGIIYLFNGNTYSKCGQLFHSVCNLTHLHFIDRNENLVLQCYSNLSNDVLEWNVRTKTLIRSFRCNAYAFLSLREPKLPAIPQIHSDNSIAALCYNRERGLLAVSFEDSSVHLIGSDHYRDTLIGHYSNVTAVAFLCDDATLLTIGGSDFSVFQYRYY
uniref:Echinoderm microtubuleassociated protein putative n=1 Tax=Albugo laibachii Nc14 TaxID=890382 RepID=F0W5Q1_9STRA|nr:echinoderm microtubuleassociated protein putative [Albugo laibachii Nc14]|eukprot:CCA16442.1 echinoderm microtubuleassociated protein putative [Albugo laibachii Nc14]